MTDYQTEEAENRFLKGERMMKKTYDAPRIKLIQVNANVDTLNDSVTIGTDGNEFGGWIPLG